jgi:hypothetical protein
MCVIDNKDLFYLCRVNIWKAIKYTAPLFTDDVVWLSVGKKTAHVVIYRPCLFSYAARHNLMYHVSCFEVPLTIASTGLYVSAVCIFINKGNLKLMHRSTVQRLVIIIRKLNVALQVDQNWKTDSRKISVFNTKYDWTSTIRKMNQWKLIYLLWVMYDYIL